MNKNFYFLHVCLIWALTLALAGLLLVLGIKAVFTGSRFPSHQLLILFMFISLAWIQTGPREMVLFRKLYRHTTRVASSALSRMAKFATRAAEAAALFFSTQPFNRPRTQP
jgi:hypothetical protein